MSIEVRNIFPQEHPAATQEQLTLLLTAPNMHLERIVSHAHTSPEGFWYDQEWAEWVIVLKGSAGVHFEGEKVPRELKAGDYLDIPAHARHRVVWTDATEPTVWLALHYR